MTLAIFNGSPRKQKSNSKILTDHFLQGYRSVAGQKNVITEFLSAKDQMVQNLETFSMATDVIIIFPLYTDSMPGVVKEFLEKIYFLQNNRTKNLGFIVQSGFPEAIHSVYVERYLEKFTRRQGHNYLGTVIKGGVEGIQVMPPGMTRKLFDNFKKLGEHFAEKGEFSNQIMKKLKGPLRMSKVKYIGFSLISKTPLLNFYWNSQLKKNGAWEKRFDRPMETQAKGF